jgi:hypothetical protein
MDRLAGVLPGGWWDACGRLHRDVVVRALTGADEELLAAAKATDAAARVTDLLVRSLVRLGDLEPVPAEIVRGLLVADRDHLLLLVRRLTFGDRVHAELVCPWPECGERVSLEFAITDLPVHAAAAPAPDYTLAVPTADGPREVVFRLPTGGDQEELSPWAARDEAGALTALLRRCVLRIDAAAQPAPEQVDALGPRARAALEAEMERVAPRVERTVDTVCAECGRGFVAPFDLHRFFFGELRTDRGVLYREVHHLAFHYHWSEPDIMAMARPKRRAYLDLLAEEIDRYNDGV